MDKQNAMRSINPATEEVLATFEPATAAQIEQTLAASAGAYKHWRDSTFDTRAQLMRRAAAYLRQQHTRLAGLITAEMGKPLAEAEAEVEKCAGGCDFYAAHAQRLLADEAHPSSAAESYVQFTPLGSVLAIMPWNFPLWQLFRFAAPALMAGNTAILKHASNVPQCALASQEVFQASGFPDGVFRTLLIGGNVATQLIDDPRIAAVTLTGSDAAGSTVAAAAGHALKKTVLELGGSDPFIVLEDADIAAAVDTGVRARYQNAGQSCIAAKRFIIVEPVFSEFQERFLVAVRALRVGDPADPATQMGPLARDDLRDSLETQVQRSVQGGARILTGGARRPGRGYFFEPTVLADVTADMPVSCDEVFGPVAPLIRVPDAAAALRVANDSAFGLGANLWTRDVARARQLARRLEAGQVFINGMVASDPRLPFGGIKRSGYGRELSAFGIREFVNIQTVWIGPKR